MMSPDLRQLQLPFFDDVHRQLAHEIAAWIAKQDIDEADDRRACKQWVARKTMASSCLMLTLTKW